MVTVCIDGVADRWQAAVDSKRLCCGDARRTPAPLCYPEIIKKVLVVAEIACSIVAGRIQIALGHLFLITIV